MIVKLNHQELKQMITEAVKRVEERISPTQVFAGLIWHYCINAQDHFYKAEYYDLPVSFQYDNDEVNILEVNYLKQRSTWTLVSTDYKHILRIAPLVLKWMDDTYFAYVASKRQMSAPGKPKGRRKGMKTRRPRQRSRKSAIVQSPSILTTPLSQPQSFPRQASKTQEKQKEQGRKPTANSQVRAEYEGQEQTTSNG